MVGIDGEWQVRNLANGLDEFSVAFYTHLDLQSAKTSLHFAYLLLDNFRSVDADGVGCVGATFGRKSKKAPYRLAEYLSHKVVEGDVDGGLGCEVVGSRFVIVEVHHVCKDVVGAKRVIE